MSSDDLDFATLPSLIRLPLDDVSISQFPGDLVPENTSAVDGNVRELPTSQLPSEINGNLRPFLNDALIPDTGLAESIARFTATEPSLNADVANHRSAVRVNLPIPNEELLSVPTLPSLRPNARPSLSPTSQTSADVDGLTPAVVGELVNAGLTDAGRVASAQPSSTLPIVIENSSPVSAPAELDAQLRTDELRPGSERESEGLALVLPSLRSAPKRAKESSRAAEGLASGVKQPDARNDSVVPLAVNAGSADTDSIVEVPGFSKTESPPDVLRNGVGDATRSSESAITTEAPAVAGSDGLSLYPVASPNVPDADDGVAGVKNVRLQPEVVSRATLNPKANLSPANSEHELQATQRPAVEVNIVDSDSGTNAGRSALPQSVDVEAVPTSAARPSDEAASLRNDAGKVTVDPTSARTQKPTRRVVESVDHQSKLVVEAANASRNSVVDGSGRLESSADSEPERLNIRDLEGSG